MGKGMAGKAEREQLKALRDYATGRVGTREAIRRAGLKDHAELIIALLQHDLDLPKPAATQQQRVHLEHPRAIRQPSLRGSRNGRRLGAAGIG
jgi:hypothetical protein